MALFKLADDVLEPIAQTTFTALGLRERENIQRAIRHHIHAITPGVKTMVLAEEFGDWVDVNRRIDLLCIDDEARLVIVELKRDHSAHMELQALRYAAMVSTMRFEQAVEAHRKYLKSIGSLADPEGAIREFLEADEGPVALSETVRIVLAASDFSTELTTAVLWLNKQGLDIRCVQMRPHPVDGAVLLDVNQLIPLPAAQQYQVALREKTIEQQAAVRTQSRDMTRYDLTIGERTFVNLPKRRLIFELFAEATRRAVMPEQIAAAVPWRETTMFISEAGRLDEQAFQDRFKEKDLARYYVNEEDLIYVGGRTYAFSRMWGERTLEAVANIEALLRDEPSISYSPTSAVVEEATFDDYRIRRREQGTIEVERGGVAVEPAMPALRQLAARLNVVPQNGRGNDLNTRQLGAAIIKAIESL